MAVGEEDIATETVEFTSPDQRLVGARLDNRRVPWPAIGDVPIAGEDSAGLVVFGFDSNEVAEVVVFEIGELLRWQAIVGRAGEQPWGEQFIG